MAESFESICEPRAAARAISTTTLLLFSPITVLYMSTLDLDL